MNDHKSAGLAALEASYLSIILTPDSQSLSGDFTVDELTSNT